MESEFTTIGIAARPAAFFVTEDGGKLRIVWPTDSDKDHYKPYIVTLSFALGFASRSEEMDFWDVCYCRTQVADADGTLWEAKSLFSANTLLENIEDLRRNSGAHRFDQTTDEIKQAFETRPLLTGVQGFYDDRFYRRIILDDQIYEILFKYQYPFFDIAFLQDPNRSTNPEKLTDDRSRLLVRVSNFKSREMNEIPPFVYEMDCETLMFYVETQGLPVPLVFKKVGVVEQKQSLIQYVPIGVGH